MRKTLCICLLTLAIVMLFCASGALFLGLPCCKATNKPRKTSIGPIMACVVQKPRCGCQHHAFHIKTNSGKSFCLDPNLPWLKKEIKEGKLKCPPEISHKLRFEVLDEDDLE